MANLLSFTPIVPIIAGGEVLFFVADILRYAKTHQVELVLDGFKQTVDSLTVTISFSTTGVDTIPAGSVCIPGDDEADGERMTVGLNVTEALLKLPKEAGFTYIHFDVVNQNKEVVKGVVLDIETLRFREVVSEQ